MFEWIATTYGAQYSGQEIPGGKTPGLFAELLTWAKEKAAHSMGPAKGL